MYKQNPKSPLMKAMLGDLNKDGKMSSYETARQNAIEKSMAKSPAKQVKDPVTGKKVKGYAKANDKVSKVRDRQERKERKAELKASAKADGKVTRLERKGINKSMRDLKTKQQNKRVVEFQRQKTSDIVSRENARVGNKAKKLKDAVKVGYDVNKANKKFNKAADKADKRIEKAKRVQARTEKNVKM